MRHAHRQLLVLVFGALLARSAFAEEPWTIPRPDRLVAVSDIHGAYDAFVSILRKSVLVDADGRWSGGRTHLVIVGDVLDRGPASHKALDLIMALQPQARADGGDVNFVLGNHEVMNIVGDLHYVPVTEFAAYADSEPEGARSKAFAHFREQRDPAEDPALAQAAFDERYPPGFFGHRQAFSRTGKYGAWLLEQPLLLVTGDIAFVHGGVSEAFADMPGAQINQILKQQLRDYVAAMETLFAADILSPADDFYDHPAAIERFETAVAAGTTSWPAGAEQAAERVKALNDAPLFALASPIWYRGMVGCSPLVARDRWRHVLGDLGVAHVVVGHTPTPDALILSRMDGGILRIDTGMLTSYYGGRPAALIVDDGSIAAQYAIDGTPSSPIPQPRRAGSRPARLTDDELESILREAPITSRTTVGERTRVTLRSGDTEVQADFYPAERAEILPAVAAYRLDRLLGLGMVPVTVERTLDDAAGALQFVPTAFMTETERSASGVGGSAWCPLRDQFPAMYVFDILTFNEARGLDQIAYEPESFQLLLLGNEQTFSTKRGRPRHLRDATIALTDAWREALDALDEQRLGSALGDVLSNRQIRALSRRIGELEDSSRKQ